MKIRRPRPKNSHERRDLARQLDASIEEIKKLRLEKQNLLTKLYTDELTGIANRRAFEEKLPELIKVACDSHEALALLIADVDGLKRTNDSLGHTAGDKLLKTVAMALTNVARETDLVGRLGGDEYYAILPGFSPLPSQSQDELFKHTADRYRDSFTKYLDRVNLPSKLDVDVSFGIAVLQPNDTASDLFHRADLVAREHKKRGYAKLAAQGIKFKDERLES